MAVIKWMGKVCMLGLTKIIFYINCDNGLVGIEYRCGLSPGLNSDSHFLPGTFKAWHIIYLNLNLSIYTQIRKFGNSRSTFTSFYASAVSLQSGNDHKSKDILTSKELLLSLFRLFYR